MKKSTLSVTVAILVSGLIKNNYVKTTRFDWWNKVDQKSRLTFVFQKWVHFKGCST